MRREARMRAQNTENICSVDCRKRLAQGSFHGTVLRGAVQLDAQCSPARLPSRRRLHLMCSAWQGLTLRSSSIPVQATTSCQGWRHARFCPWLQGLEALHAWHVFGSMHAASSTALQPAAT
jgi:hypothetical protein